VKLLRRLLGGRAAVAPKCEAGGEQQCCDEHGERSRMPVKGSTPEPADAISDIPLDLGAQLGSETLFQS
jgi:flagellar motor switch/type III secretory pathway protein FliN